MRIAKIIASEGVGGSYCSDQVAIANGAVVDGLFVRGKPVLPGFPRAGTWPAPYVFRWYWTTARWRTAMAQASCIRGVLEQTRHSTLGI